MSVRSLAIELYKVQQKVHGLEEELENSPLKSKEKVKLELKLARAELKVLRNMLDGEKAEANPPSRLVPFGSRY